jgi:hypothetical protein
MDTYIGDLITLKISFYKDDNTFEQTFDKLLDVLEYRHNKSIEECSIEKVYVPPVDLPFTGTFDRMVMIKMYK